MVCRFTVRNHPSFLGAAAGSQKEPGGHVHARLDMINIQRFELAEASGLVRTLLFLPYRFVEGGRAPVYILVFHLDGLLLQRGLPRRGR